MYADDYTQKTYHDYGLLKKLDEEEGLSSMSMLHAPLRLHGFTPYFR